MDKFERPVIDPELKRRIADLIAYKGGGYNEDYVADLVDSYLPLAPPSPQHGVHPRDKLLRACRPAVQPRCWHSQ